MSDRDEGMCAGVTHPHSHSVHHSSGASPGSALCGSCVFQLCAIVHMCDQFVCMLFTACLCILSIFPLSFCQYQRSPCVHVQCIMLHVCIKCVCMCFICMSMLSTSSCPSGAAMQCCSANTLIAPISLWFAASYRHEHIYTNARKCMNAHTYLHS